MSRLLIKMNVTFEPNQKLPLSIMCSGIVKSYAIGFSAGFLNLSTFVINTH